MQYYLLLLFRHSKAVEPSYIVSEPTEYTYRDRVEIGGSGAYTTTLYMMVDIVKGGGRALPPLTGLDP